MSTATDDALVREAELLADERAATHSEQAATDEHASIRQERVPLLRKLMDARKRQALGREGADDEVKAASSALTDLDEREKVALGRREAARAAFDETKAERERLYKTEFAAFAEDAETLTAEAHAAMAALAGPYHLAMEAWKRAESSWNRLSPAISDELRAADEDAGRHRKPDSADTVVPEWPFGPEAAFVLTRVAHEELAARPPAITPDDAMPLD